MPRVQNKPAGVPVDGNALVPLLGATPDDTRLQALLDGLDFAHKIRLDPEGDGFAFLKPHGIQIEFEQGVVASIGFYSQRDSDCGRFQGTLPLGVAPTVRWDDSATVAGFAVVSRDDAGEPLVMLDAGAVALELVFDDDGGLAKVFVHLKPR